MPHAYLPGGQGEQMLAWLNEMDPGEHGTGGAASPTQKAPAGHGAHETVVPLHAVTTPAAEKYPGLQLHGVGCDALPAHECPALQFPQLGAVPCRGR